jgi:hypothetical protein
MSIHPSTGVGAGGEAGWKEETKENNKGAERHKDTTKQEWRKDYGRKQKAIRT